MRRLLVSIVTVGMASVFVVVAPAPAPAAVAHCTITGTSHADTLEGTPETT